jgi:coenzyme PQQ precursor peptide PqqA
VDTARADSKARLPAARFGDPAEFALCGCLGAVVTYIRLRLWALTRTGQDHRRSDAMAWSTPEVREVCVGMEVTSYLSAEM